LNQNQGFNLYFDAFSSREQVSTSLENALKASAARGHEVPPAHPITAVEKACRYLIWWITIIKYNLKARHALPGHFQPIGITSTER
jgi:hypothetical protein